MRSLLLLSLVECGGAATIAMMAGCDAEEPMAEFGAAVAPVLTSIGTAPVVDAGEIDRSDRLADAGVPSTSGGIPGSLETVKLVFGGGGPIMSCAAAPCHGVGGAAPPSHPLELPPNDDRQLLSNLQSYVSEACGKRRLVVPGNPEESALLSILRGPCGATPRMPYGCSDETGDCIPDDYIEAISLWILSGARAE